MRQAIHCRDCFLPLGVRITDERAVRRFACRECGSVLKLDIGSFIEPDFGSSLDRYVDRSLPIREIQDKLRAHRETTGYRFLRQLGAN